MYALSFCTIKLLRKIRVHQKRIIFKKIMFFTHFQEFKMDLIVYQFLSIPGIAWIQPKYCPENQF